MPTFLVTNDDGIFSEGIRCLARALGRLGEVVVVAPDREQSATGHALTIHRPLRMVEIEPGWHSVDGTPTDCVTLGVLSLLRDRRPDLVVSGINFGVNMGDDVTYSGTVSAAFEGNLLRLPSIAFSQEIKEGYSFERSADLAAAFIEGLIKEPLPEELLLNVNFPAGRPNGLEMTRLGHRVYSETVVEKTDPRGRKYFWIAGTPEWKEQEGTDYSALAGSRISVTPLHLDLTDYDGQTAYAPRVERIAQALTERLSPEMEAGIPDHGHKG